MVYLVDDEDVVRDALAWLLRSRRLLSEGFGSAEAFEAMLTTKSPAALVDSAGLHSGWMSAAVDISDQRRIEDLSRQQQERLQATARVSRPRWRGACSRRSSRPAAKAWGWA